MGTEPLTSVPRVRGTGYCAPPSGWAGMGRESDRNGTSDLDYGGSSGLRCKAWRLPKDRLVLMVHILGTNHFTASSCMGLQALSVALRHPHEPCSFAPDVHMLFMVQRGCCTGSTRGRRLPAPCVPGAQLQRPGAEGCVGAHCWPATCLWAVLQQAPVPERPPPVPSQVGTSCIAPMQLVASPCLLATHTLMSPCMHTPLSGCTPTSHRALTRSSRPAWRLQPCSSSVTWAPEPARMRGAHRGVQHRGSALPLQGPGSCHAVQQSVHAQELHVPPPPQRPAPPPPRQHVLPQPAGRSSAGPGPLGCRAGPA